MNGLSEGEVSRLVDGWIDVGAKPLKECLVNALSLSGKRLTEMGERGRRLVESKYVIDITARTMRCVYE